MSTWSHENRVNKHFVIFPNLATLSNSLFTVLFAYVFFFSLVLWLGISVEEDGELITILPPPPPPSYFFPAHNSFSNTSYSYLKTVRA